MHWIKTLHFPKRNVLAPLFTSFFSLCVYFLTLAPEVDWGDSAELSLQAYQLGVTHPPGYPIHSFLGKGINLIVSDPAFATNLLSVVCTVLTVGLLSLLILDLTQLLSASLIVPLIFAFCPQIWSMAITTEIHNINILFLALSFYLVLFWYKNSSFLALIWSSILFGVSLGTYLANLLLLPAFAFLLYKGSKKRFHEILLFVSVVGIVGISVLSFSYFRAYTLPPIGTQYIPCRSFMDTLRYFTGQQYGTLMIHDFWFYLIRPMEHAARFGYNFLGIGIILGLSGLFIQRHINRDLFLFFFLILAINLGYFTFYNQSDFYTMVTPSYFIFSIWIAYGFLNKLKFKLIIISAAILTCMGLLIIQLPNRIDRANKYPVTDSAISLLNNIPQNAIVICEWKRLTPLLFFQKTKHLRQDITLIEHVEETRYYEQEKVDNYLEYITFQISLRPIIIDEVNSILLKDFNVKVLDQNWYRIDSSKF